jgi:formamidopyrimidine-DNA glycosylase
MKEIKNLGAEPLTPAFTKKVFAEIVKKRPKKPIKMLLLDQQLISGIGNIYASEALFWAKILPTRLAGSLSEVEIKALYNSINKVLKEGIATGGSSENTYVDLYGEKGSYLKKEVVYRREGQNCPRHCGGQVKRLKQGGRSSFFCAKCQK